MIYCLTGELIFLDALTMTAVVDCGGVGYKVTVTENTLTHLNSADKNKVRVYTHMAVREDAVELYGFASTEEMNAFKMLITVSGVGPKAACAILTVLTPEALAMCIAAEDAKAIAKAQGVGAKTAARVVLELKDKMAKNMPTIHSTGAATAAAPRGGSLADARDALIVLGYSRSEIAEALKGADAKAETEELIRYALAKLMK